MKFKELNLDVQYVLIGIASIFVVIPICIMLSPVMILLFIGKFFAPIFGVKQDE